MSTTEFVAWAGHAIEWDLWPHTKIQRRLRLRQTVSLYESNVDGFPKATLYWGSCLGAGALGW